MTDHPTADHRTTDHHDHDAADHDCDHPSGLDWRDCPLSFDDLTEALRTQARGSYAAEAAVELLIDHSTWLRRNDSSGSPTSTPPTTTAT